MTPAEWDDLPWWEQRAYIEMMLEDKTLSDGSEESDGDYESSPMGSSGRVTDLSGETDFSGYGFSSESI